MFDNTFDEFMFLDTDLLETIDEITTDLFEIEESAIMALGVIMPGDQLLQEFHLPLVADLLHIPCEG
jgi:hypothetical protein